VALIKLILVFLLSQVCIIFFFSVTTSSYALPYPAGAGRGTLDCGHFIETTTEIDEDGELSGRSYIHRLEYVQWAFGFFTAFNIRHYEKTNTFKDLRPVAGKDVGYEDMYNKLVIACDQIKIEEDGNFGMAVYSIFSNLPGESI
jgi:hypothetical protein